MKRELYQMILVFFLYVPINPYNATKAIFIKLGK